MAGIQIWSTIRGLDGTAYLGTFIYETIGNALIWPNSDRPGTNLFDSGFPLYDTYETADGKFVVLGALESRFHVPLIES